MEKSKQNEKSCSPKRDEWFEDFLYEELKHNMWSYQDEEGFPIWSFVRNMVASKINIKKNNYNMDIHAPTSRNDYVFKYPLEHLRTIKKVFFGGKNKHGACFFSPAAVLMKEIEGNIQKRDRIHGGFYSLFETPLIFEWPYQGFFSRQIEGVEKSDVYYLPTIKIMAKMSEPFVGGGIIEKYLEKIAQKIEELSKKTINKQEALCQLKRIKGQKIFYKLFVQQIAKRVPGKKVFINCGCYLGLNALLSWHFHNLGFDVIELQHGYIGSNSHEYNYPQDIFNLPGVKKVFPDYYLTFGEKWGKDISIPSQIIPVGNKYLEDYVKNADQPEEETDKNILVVSQGTVTQKMLEIAKTLASAFLDKKTIFKLHPGEVPFKERYKGLERYKNIEIVGFENIFALISKSRFIVGHNSTTLFEALAFPNKLIYCTNNVYTSGEKGFSLFETPEDLVQMIREKRGMVSCGISEEYWKSNWQEQIKNLPFI